jgi:YD repeat-containing protein
LTNRWSAAKGATTYKYDQIGNLTNVVYPVSPAITMKYDPLSRLTNMVDAVGTTVYGYANQFLASEGGPWKGILGSNLNI